MKNKLLKPVTNKALIVVLVLVFIFLAITALELANVTNFTRGDNPAATTDQTEEQETINFDPPTDKEKEAGDEKKDEITKNQPDQEPAPSAPVEDNRKSVKPIITSAGHYEDQIEVRSFVPGIYENSGTCTVVFMQNNNRIERQVEGIQDATTTRCDTVTILREDFPSSGTWTVKVNYSSPSSQGESDVASFEVN